MINVSNLGVTASNIFHHQHIAIQALVWPLLAAVSVATLFALTKGLSFQIKIQTVIPLLGA